MTHQYQISGMTCGSCVARVKSELLKLGDVVSANVQLQSPQASVSMNRHITTADLQKAVGRAGDFTITEQNQINKLLMKEDEATGDRPSSFPVFLIFGFIAGITLLIQVVKDSFSWMQWMGHFMAGFFFVFSFFKFMNLQGFAQGYRNYDVLAKRFPVWGYIYPFVELGLGIAFLTSFMPLGTNVATFLVMGISCIGIIQSLLKRSSFQCACLGTVIKLPLSKITLFEDALMMTMSLIMIINMLYK